MAISRITSICAIISVLILAGCVPQWRVFQKSVPAPVYNTVDEGEREAAFWLAENIVSPTEARSVASALSASLGMPKVPVLKLEIQDSRDLIISHLSKENSDYQDKLVSQQKFLAKNQGVELEGTGINLFGGSVVLSIGAVIAACIFIPGFGGVVFWVIRRFRKAVAEVAQGVEGFKAEHPEMRSEVGEWLQSQMNDSSIRIVESAKKSMNWADVHEALKTKSASTKG